MTKFFQPSTEVQVSCRHRLTRQYHCVDCGRALSREQNEGESCDTCAQTAPGQRVQYEWPEVQWVLR